jgi:hypothetical protein
MGSCLCHQFQMKKVFLTNIYIEWMIPSTWTRCDYPRVSYIVICIGGHRGAVRSSWERNRMSFRQTGMHGATIDQGNFRHYWKWSHTKGGWNAVISTPIALALAVLAFYGVSMCSRSRCNASLVRDDKLLVFIECLIPSSSEFSFVDRRSCCLLTNSIEFSRRWEDLLSRKEFILNKHNAKP